MKDEIRDSLYTSGSMEYNKDPETWRERMQNALKHKVHVINPKIMEIPFNKDEDNYRDFVYRNFVMPDLSDVARCKYFFIKIDKAVFKGAGTISELSLAAWMNKHIVAMFDDIEMHECPGWLLGCLSNAYFVKDVEDGIAYYKSILGIK
jgi:hypothetical protein